MNKNGQDFLGRPIRLDFYTEPGALGSKSDFNSRNDQDQKSGCTVFVRGFDKNQEEDDVSCQVCFISELLFFRHPS